MRYTNDNDEPEKKINFQILGNIGLLIIFLLIIGNSIIIYYLIHEKSNQIGPQPIEDVSETNQIKNENVETVANLINTVVANSTANSSAIINSSDADSRKVQNENLVVLYDGLILDTSKMDEVELKYIDNTSVDKDKYIITYYNYENFKFNDSTLGSFSEQVYENLVSISNVGKVAISENYKAITSDITVVNTLPNVITEKNDLKEYDAVKAVITDFDADATNEYVVVLANKKTGYSKISVFDSNGKFIDDLAYIEKNQWYQQGINDEYYLSLENINILDVDNDGIMEILIEIPKYEGTGSVSIVKYKKGELTGKTNIKCSILP